MSRENELADLAARIQQATTELTTPEVRKQRLPQQILDVAVQLGVQVLIGTIMSAGQYSGDSYVVEFDNQSTGGYYSSFWPLWAFQLAHAALLAGKRVLLITNGDPFGSNLISVQIISW